MIQIRKTKIGEGIPKICVPIVETTQDAILEIAESLRQSDADLIEWRLDFFEASDVQKSVLETASLLRSILGEKLLLVTFRTKWEGGEKEISWDAYASIMKALAVDGNVDMIDIEMFTGMRQQEVTDWSFYLENQESFLQQEEFHKVNTLVSQLKQYVKVIGSYHDFSNTPNKEELVARLLCMKQLGADIPKIAVMPQNRKDVFDLMEATMVAQEHLKETPLITMSMTGMGAISRIAGAFFGSSVTFACFGKTSAPGQIELKELKQMLQCLHNSISQ